MRQKPNKRRSVTQFLEYSLGGMVYFASGYAAFFVFDHLWHWPLFAAKQLANIIGFSLNYIVQRYLAFSRQVRGQSAIRLERRYLLLTAINFMIDYLIIAGLKRIGITPYIGQFVSAGFFTLWNFWWYGHWVFAPRRSKKHGQR